LEKGMGNIRWPAAQHGGRRRKMAKESVSTVGVPIDGSGMNPACQTQWDGAGFGKATRLLVSQTPMEVESA
jgi:hypothetical protein